MIMLQELAASTASCSTCRISPQSFATCEAGSGGYSARFILVRWSPNARLAKGLVAQHVVVHAGSSEGASERVELIQYTAHAPDILSASQQA